ncbi:acetyl-CoA carboxylase biotin carboxyl carrier protein [Helicobacter turcicus]|uniref:Biotin carboxyl carrier protein of acetyl-CoA carboxylase n=1 Tax=Helicobacter turcicus TaxID=2867412 RepID=A0ABS7JM40_9HELI|nr:acetyl-CoA carboxylase biotin carboxyl carrier protein [Helicobacter turcicus]MBX7490464.1 acetyl-CoA carboxylase biotin carboxyl carrier protein [Helicobacter turcicus]MBX7545324.1 acetyl-CoA carboxylase biotin carboxyl carrier protein [Helicobacter turcicus]
MDFKDIKELIKIFDASTLNRLSITQDTTKIKLEKGAGRESAPTLVAQTTSAPTQATQSLPQVAPVASALAPAAPSGDTINSPMVGTFYRCPSPNAPAYVNVGDKVKKGQTLGIIEAMKIMNEIEAEFDCKIVEIIPNDAQPVEYNSPLFVVERL